MPAPVPLTQSTVVCIDGVRVGTLGPRATSVFGASTACTDASETQVSIMIADTPDMLAGMTSGISRVALADLPAMASVPAVDVRVTNPIGWKSAADPPLGPQQAPSRDSPDPRVLRRVHHVADWTSASSDPAVRAGELAAAAAAGGIVCVTDGGPKLESCLGEQLYALMTDAERIASAGDHEREAISIAMRRAALRDHSMRARLSQALTASGRDTPLLPLVSVLVPTRRPDRLHDVVAAVAAQTFPRVELVVGLHGDGFDNSEVRKLLQLGFPVQTVFVPEDRCLGDVLNTALAVAQGSLIAKFDDDDLYGADHLWDLVLAAEYSGAALVGKASEYVYLAGADCTIRRFAGFGERYIDPARSSVAGGTALVSREMLEAIGGWRPLGVGEDKALVSDIAAHGGDVYRTHGSGYLLMRHGDGHTWDVEDAYFLEQAQDRRSGCDCQFAGIS